MLRAQWRKEEGTWGDPETGSVSLSFVGCGSG